MAYTIPGFLKTLTEWLVSVSRWFDGWDITILVPALIILTVIAGVTGRAATGPRLWMQLVWGTVTVILGLIEVAIIWTIIARYLPVWMIPFFITSYCSAKHSNNALIFCGMRSSFGSLSSSLLRSVPLYPASHSGRSRCTAIIWTMGPPCGLFQFLQKGFLDMNDDIG